MAEMIETAKQITTELGKTKDLNEKFKWLNAGFQWNTRDNEIVNRLLTNYFDYRILFKE